MSDVLSTFRDLPCELKVEIANSLFQLADYRADRLRTAVEAVVDRELDRLIAAREGTPEPSVVMLDLSPLTQGELNRGLKAIDQFDVPGAERFIDSLRAALQAERELRFRGTCKSGRCGMRRKVQAN